MFTSASVYFLPPGVYDPCPSLLSPGHWHAPPVHRLIAQLKLRQSHVPVEHGLVIPQTWSYLHMFDLMAAFSYLPTSSTLFLRSMRSGWVGEGRPSVEDVHIIHRPQTGLVLGRADHLPGQRRVCFHDPRLGQSPLHILESTDVGGVIVERLVLLPSLRHRPLLLHCTVPLESRRRRRRMRKRWRRTVLR